MGTVSTLFVYFILIAALQKLYAIGKDLAEIRNVLKEFKRERDATSVVANLYNAPAPGRPEPPTEAEPETAMRTM